MYFLIGWVVPVLMTTAWAIVTGLHISAHCWFGYNHTYYYWILEGPRLALIAVSYYLHLYICKALPRFFSGQFALPFEHSTRTSDQVEEQQL